MNPDQRRVNPDQLLTIEQVSDWLQVPVRTLRQWRAHPRRAGAVPLPSIKIGGQLRYRAAEVEAWLDQNTSAAPARVRQLRRGA